MAEQGIATEDIVQASVEVEAASAPEVVQDQAPVQQEVEEAKKEEEQEAKKEEEEDDDDDEDEEGETRMLACFPALCFLSLSFEMESSFILLLILSVSTICLALLEQSPVVTGKRNR